MKRHIWRTENYFIEFLLKKLHKILNVIFLGIKICGSTRDDCHRDASCTDTGPGTYQCTCNEGFTGDGKSCSGMLEN